VQKGRFELKALKKYSVNHPPSKSDSRGAYEIGEMSEFAERVGILGES
jgi:hypothetical protein